MANIKQHNETLEEIAEYIEANNFLRDNSSVSSTQFIKENKAIVIYGDKVSFQVCCDGNFHEYASVDGISILDYMGWVHVLNAFKIISIKESIASYRKHSRRQIDLKLVKPQPLNMVALAETILQIH